MKNVTIILAVVVMLAVPAWAADTWDDGDPNDHNWNSDLNWTDNTKPARWEDPPGTWNTDSVSLSTDDFVELHGSAVSSDFNMTGNSTLDVYDGADYQKYGSGGFCVKGSGGDTGPWSVITQHGGTMDLYWDMRLGYHSSSSAGIKTRGRYIMSGGTLIVPQGATAGVAYGSYSHEKCLGEFIVVGGGADEISTGGFTVDDSTYDSTFDPGYTGPPLRSKLEFQFDGDADPIQRIDVAGNLTLGGILKITDDTGPTPDGTYTLIAYGNGNTLTLSPNLDEQIPSGWSIKYDDRVDTDGDDIPDADGVTVTVPEPATMCLLAVGGIGVLIRRKRA